MPYTICMVYPDFIVMGKYAKENNLPTDPAEMIKDERIVKLFEDAIKNQLEGKFGNYEIPRKLFLMSDGFSVENGMLTQTLKLKRRAVLQKYQVDIDRLYKEK
jgi:long-chain acyl-CoA synthetase